MSTTIDTPSAADEPRAPAGDSRGDATSASTVRQLTLGALAVAAAAIAAIVLLTGGSTYTINAHFLDAGQLVSGGLVEVAGRDVGTISNVTLTPDGLADVQLSISDPDYVPLHQGTYAGIRAVGQAGVTNRFVDLTPGPSYAPSLRNGSVLSTDYTSGIVDIDELLDAFTPPTRQSIRALISHSAQVFAGSGSRYFNGVLAKLSPALAQTAGVTGQLAADRAGLAQLISTASRASQAVASRSADLQGAVANTARALGAIASERAAFSDDLARAPGVLSRATATLARTRPALIAVRPDLDEIPPAAGPLALVLSRLTPAAARLLPVTDELDRLLPSLNVSLRGLTPLAPVADSALRATTTALKDSMHIFKGLREYGSDLAIGVFAGLGGISSAPYDAVGHYLRVEAMASPQASTGGLLQTLLGNLKLIPGLSGVRTALAPCPGGAAPPAPDHSNPWIPDPSICNPLDDHP
jgi:phospholipid/cholesterol/gamma-HCH transport system substrate-binding protein